MGRRVARLVAVGLLLSTVALVAGCGGSTPSAADLEGKHDVAGLVAMAATSDEHDPAAAAAVESLRRLADPATYDVLAGALRTETVGERRYVDPGAVIRVLGLLGGPRAVATILEGLRALEPSAAALGSPLHTPVVRALVTIGADAVEPLAVILETPENPDIGDVDGALRSIAIDVFGGVGEGVPRVTGTGALGSDRAEQVLLAELRSGGERSGAAGTALVARRSEQLDLVLPLLDDPSTVGVYSGLVRLGRAGTEPALLAALGRITDDGAVGLAMAKAFAASGNQALVDAGEAWASGHGHVLLHYCPLPPCDDSGTWGTLFSAA